MVLEALIGWREAEHNSWKIFLLGLLYASIGLLLSYWVFYKYSSMVMIFLTVLASAHIMHKLVEIEERVAEKTNNETKILWHHARALKAFMALFLGFVIAYTFWYGVLDYQTTGVLFDAQVSEYRRIALGITGASTIQCAPGEAICGLERFNLIFGNNMKVLLFALLFGFFYGYGAIFVLTWNASVVAVAAGITWKDSMLMNPGILNSITAFITSLLQYALHGIPEMLAFFMAALASGILGAGIIRKTWKDPEVFRRIIVDFLELGALSAIILLIAAILEVWVTPLLGF
ncbi:MAG: stage II sporulation protein M [Candidatus Woesearchaeota archaeon]